MEKRGPFGGYRDTGYLSKKNYRDTGYLGGKFKGYGMFKKRFKDIEDQSSHFLKE